MRLCICVCVCVCAGGRELSSLQCKGARQAALATLVRTHGGSDGALIESFWLCSAVRQANPRKRVRCIAMR
jgi:hypothetical protein